MTDADLTAAFRATWPAAEYATVGGFRVGRGAGGGGRVSAARVAGDWQAGNWQADDIERVADLQRDWAEAPLFAVADDDAALARALRERSWRDHTATVVLQAPVAALTDRTIPPVTTFAVWPPLAIQRDLWRELGIGAARQAIIDRAAAPKAALLGRVADRAAGAGFVGVHGPVAMIHALGVLPPFRRHGVAGWLIRQAAHFAQQNAAERIALAVQRDNAAALALYAALGFSETDGYRYFSPAA